MTGLGNIQSGNFSEVSIVLWSAEGTPIVLS